MAVAKSIEFIIRQECLPLRECMLTVTDINGEAGFLYFKDAELIEANYAALWGKEALAQIVNWELAEHTVAPLPLGIKRSLWDQLEQLIQPSSAGAPLVGTSTGRLTSTRRFATPTKKPNRGSALDQYKKIPALYRIISLHQGKGAIVFDAAPKGEMHEDIGWISLFAEQVSITGESLGFGHSSNWSLETDKYQMVMVPQKEGYFVLLRRTDAGYEDLGTDVQMIEQEMAGEA